MTDAIKLTIPHAKPYHGVVRLVIGGLAARLDLSYDSLEDLQLALETLLANDAYSAGDEVTVEVIVGDESVEVLVGPLDGRRLGAELERAEELEGVALARLLKTVVERIGLEEREGAHWIRLEKPIRGAGTPATR